MIKLTKELNGRILDIGGGGEGIIGRLYKSQVVAIDNCQTELDEAPEGFEKVLMDATELAFLDNSFDHVTFFFTLMFMSAEEHRCAILEAARVLKYGGQLHVWDCEILSAYPEPFCLDVVVQLPEERVTTTYGIGKIDTQNKQSIIQMCKDAELVLLAESIGEPGFYLRFKKQHG